MSVILYKVGGCVRDEFLGLKSKDIDYAVEAVSYSTMREYILSEGGTIFLEKPEYQTIRAKLAGEDADFVLCRKDGAYSDGRHPDSVEIGTIYDDLARRDFTVNAIAYRIDTDEYIDPFDGVSDIKKRVIRCVGSAEDRFTEDALRMIRAIRFCITKNFLMDWEVAASLKHPEKAISIKLVSHERIREEIARCFKHDTLETIRFLSDFPILMQSIFETPGLWLKPTFEGK